jgi:hypothetical protein
MICRLIEIFMLLVGIYALIVGSVPSFLLGGTQYELKGKYARLLGLLLVIPLPVAPALAVSMLLLFGESVIDYLPWVEIALLVICGVAAVIIGNSVRQPATPPSDEKKAVTDSLAAPDDLIKIEATIAKKAQGSMIYALLGILGFSAIVVCPLAFIRANQALRLIDEYHVGEQHRGAANGARILAPLVFIFYAAIAAFFVGSGVIGLLSGM